MSGQGPLAATPTRAKRKYVKRGLRPVRADFEAIPFRPTISSTDGICACSRQARCVGPRGGQFCINATENKRYTPR